MTHAGYREHLKRVEYEKKNGGWLRRLMGCYSRRPSCCPTAPPSPQPYLLILDGLSVDLLIRSAQEQLAFAIRHAATVICSRMSPKQKSRVILLRRTRACAAWRSATAPTTCR